MAVCEFCGAELTAKNNNHRRIPGAGRTASCCKDCAFSMEGRKADMPDVRQKFIAWAEETLAGEALASDLREPLRLLLDGVKERGSQPQNYGQPDLQKQRMQAYVAQSRSGGGSETRFFWIYACKVIAALVIISAAIYGGILGGKTDHFFGGLLLGLFAGFCSGAFIFMIANLCEDVASIRDKLDRDK